MPPHFSRDVAWVIQGCVLILHMMSVVMTTFMNQLAVAKTRNRVRFTMKSGVLSFWRRPENFVLYLIHRILNVTYTLDVNLRVTVHPEVSEQPQPSPPPIPIRPRSIPSHRQGSGITPDTIVPPGVPFELSCPICQCPLEQGQICRHSDPRSTVVRRDHTEPLRVHQESPFVFCCHLPNLDDPTCTILLRCPINPVIHDNSDGNVIPPSSPPRTTTPDAYHSTSSTREPSPTRERSVSPSGDLQQDEFRACGVGRCRSNPPEDTTELPFDVCNVFGETMPRPSSTPQYVRNTRSSARRSLPSRRSTETGDRRD